MVIIDKTKKITKILGILCGISTLMSIYFITKGFSFFNLVTIAFNGIMTFLCFKNFSKTKWLIVSMFGLTILNDIFNILGQQSFSFGVGMTYLLKILCSASIICYFLKIYSNKMISIISCIGLNIFYFMNIYNVYKAYENIKITTYNLFPNMQDTFATKATIISILGGITHIIPVAVLMVFIIMNILKFPKSESK